LFYFDGETALAACGMCFEGDNSKRLSTFFEEKKYIRVTWLEDFLTSK